MMGECQHFRFRMPPRLVATRARQPTFTTVSKFRAAFEIRLGQFPAHIAQYHAANASLTISPKFAFSLSYASAETRAAVPDGHY